MNGFTSIRARASAAILAIGLLPFATPAHVVLRAQSTVLVATGSAWKYLDNGSNQGTAWRGRTFDDSTWKSGLAELGYGDGDEVTIVGYGPNASAKYITTYFRRAFTVSDPSVFGSLALTLRRDDGAVVYLNGTEVFRSNMPAGTVSYTTLASTALGGTDETTYVTASVSPALLVAGTNVIAVEIHQANATSSDISFDLGLTGSQGVTLTRGPYLQLGTPSSVVIRWRTSAPVVGRVQYGQSVGANTWERLESTAGTEHKLELTGLVPGTTYYYSVGTSTTTLAGGDSSFRFTTSPPAGTSKVTRIWVLGDSGTANSNARAVRDAYYTYTGTRATDVWLMLGDNAYYTGTDSEYQAAVFDMYPTMLRRTALWPTLGNHDGYSSTSSSQTGPYFDMFTLPKQAQAGGLASGTEAYYSFDYGTIHFICLDSFGSSRQPGGPMLTWLENDLGATNQPWVIVFFHHPPYSKGSHDSDVDVEMVEMRENVLPILENAGVDLVLTGHSHSYERSFLIDGHYGLSTTFTSSMKKDGGSGREDGTGAYKKPTFGMAPHEGAVYAVAGSSGQTSGGALNHPAMYISLNSLGSMVLDVNGNRLDAAFIDQAGVKRDYFTVLKGTTSSGGVSTPHGGTRAPIPGVIQAENFDDGGAGVAYSDTTPGNTGGAYRNTDVDIAAATDTGGGYYVGWTRPGEWLKYSVDIGTTGTYTLALRVANRGTGARVHLEVDGVDKTGPLSVPDTGGWQTWQTITKSGLSLTAGSHLVRLVFDTGTAENGGVGNYNSLALTTAASTPYGGTPAALPGTVQVENFDQGGAGVAYSDTTPRNTGGAYRNTDVDIAAATDTGGGYYVGWTRPGEWLEYTVNVTTTGSYTLGLRVANKGTGAKCHVNIDGTDRTGPLPIPDTGGWQTWQTITHSGVSISAGTHVIRLVLDVGTVENGGVGNLNFLRLN